MANFRLPRLYQTRNSLYCWIKALLFLLVITSLYLHIICNNNQWEEVKGSKLDLSKGEVLSDQRPAQRLIEHTELSIQQEKNKSYINEIQMKIEQLNNAQHVFNENIYGKVTNDSVVLVVQVHNRLEYLTFLIDSLSRAKHIDHALLIFSHDYFNEEINQLIRNISFCKVMQIYFPYSVQTHPDRFPGADPRDCPRDIEKRRALEFRCQNANYPDKYGHYRESKYTQIKHHWWWKLNQVFHHLRITRNFGGLVVLLEEDQYVTDDFIHMLRLMNGKCRNTAQCHILGLGVPQSLKGINNNYGRFDEVFMQSAPTNLGLAFSRSTFFNKILTCVEAFCTYDDYNWDWSLHYILRVCHKVPLLTMVSSAPRVFHIGNCGTHVKNNDCDSTETVMFVRNLVKTLKMFPTSLKFGRNTIKQAKLIENGGWGDKRDQDLCIDIAKS